MSDAVPPPDCSIRASSAIDVKNFFIFMKINDLSEDSDEDPGAISWPPASRAETAS
jgi:hypothetical protein